MTKKLTYQHAKEYFAERGYRLVSTKYVKSLDKLSLVCPEGHRVEISLNNFKRGRRCRKCSDKKKGDKLRHSVEHIRKRFADRGYELLTEEYSGVSQKLSYRCPEGHIGTIRFNHFKQGHGCASCSKNRRLTYAYVQRCFRDRGYTLLTTSYKNTAKGLRYRCPSGHVGQICFDSFRSGSGCARCRETNGERRVAAILDLLGCAYVTQFRFSDLCDIRRLRFDFAIIHNAAPVGLIEYDGTGHFKPIRFGGISQQDAEKVLKERRKKDQMKNDYCDRNGIPLLRIPYTAIGSERELICQFLEGII
jgi:hypothetical protein